MDDLTALRAVRAAQPGPSEAETTAARNALLTAIEAAGQSSSGRRARLPVLAGGLTAAAAATAAAVLVLASGPAAGPGQYATAGHTGTVVTAAWTVHEDADGTVTIYVRQYANPAGLQHTLRADGINAIVRPIPYALHTITFTPPSGLPGSRTRKAGSRHGVAVPTCTYATTDNARRDLQHAVVTVVKQAIPAYFIIQPDAMPQGSALFLAFMVSVKTGSASNWPVKPVVLNNDTVPACVPVTIPSPKPAPTFAPKAG